MQKQLKNVFKTAFMCASTPKLGQNTQHAVIHVVKTKIFFSFIDHVNPLTLEIRDRIVSIVNPISLIGWKLLSKSQKKISSLFVFKVFGVVYSTYNRAPLKDCNYKHTADGTTTTLWNHWKHCLINYYCNHQPVRLPDSFIF